MTPNIKRCEKYSFHKYFFFNTNLISVAHSLKYHDPEKGLEVCKEADSFCMVKKIGRISVFENQILYCF